MRPLTPNEKFLLTMLGLIAFAGLNFFGYRALREKETAQTLAYAELRADQAEARVSLSQQATWEKREAWISSHEPVAKDEGDTKAQSLQFVLAGARGKGLQVLEQSLSDPTEDADSFRVEIALTVKGSMQALAQWLAELQDPAGFYAVPALSLKADDDKKGMICTLHLQRYFKKGGA
jgi:hypothetical protein